MLLASIFFLVIPHALSLSFNLTRSDPNDHFISYDGSAVPARPFIDLVSNRRDQSSVGSVGRATYYQPMHLWDKATRELTNFTTTFTFVIDSQDSTIYGEGMTFFLIRNGSKLPNDVRRVGGGAMGLDCYQGKCNSTDPFVAVEFDIYQNDGWDPFSYDHVGIDINSLTSVSTVQWYPNNITGGGTNEAFISYNSNTKNLSISITGFVNNSKVLQNLHQIIDLRNYLPEWVTFGFSAATGASFTIFKINSWSFTSDEFSTDITPRPSSSRTSRNSWIEPAVGTVVGVFVLIGGWGLLLFGMRKKKRKMEEDEHDSDEPVSEDFESETGPKKFSYAELASAANYFKDEQKLGQGGFGSVYKGFLKDSNSTIAIKRVSEGSKQGRKEFASEVRIISRLRHRNLVQLIGWCHERKELLLIYEYMSNRSLDYHLFNAQRLLTWSERFKITQGLASALLYLHEEWEQCVVHRDIKSSNIMLDSSFNAKLGDFGLARLVDHEKGGQTTALAGTMGYMAPEYIITSRARKESDVYSFGIVVLEIACGRKSINHGAPENELNVVEWVWKLYGRGRILEAVDPRLEGDFDSDQIECLMIVGLWCAHPDHRRRPSIRQAIHVLNFQTPFPSLPSSYPFPYELPVSSSFSILSSTNASEESQKQNISSSSNTNSSGLTTSSDVVSSTLSLLYSHKN